MLTLTSLTMRLRWEQAGSGGSSFPGWDETGFAGSSGLCFTGSGGSGFTGSKLVTVDMALLVAEHLDSL